MSKYFRVLEKHKNRNGVSRDNESLQSMEESPVEVDLDPEMRYHSVLTCPISKEQTSSENPPVRSIRLLLLKFATSKLPQGSVEMRSRRSKEINGENFEV